MQTAIVNQALSIVDENPPNVNETEDTTDLHSHTKATPVNVELK